MAAVWSVALLELLTFPWTFSRADVVSESNATTVSPFTPLNSTVPGDGSSTGVGAVIGRVAVALCVAGAVGVFMYLLKNKCPRGSNDDEHQLVAERRRVNGETRPLNGAVASHAGQSAPRRPPSLQPHQDPRPDSRHTEQP